MRRGADKGIDGRLYFHDDGSGKSKQIILSVKGGHVEHSHVRDLRGVLDREQAEIGVLITLEPPSKPMKTEAASAGFYQPASFEGRSFPASRSSPSKKFWPASKSNSSPCVDATFKQAPKAKAKKAENLTLDLG